MAEPPQIEDPTPIKVASFVSRLKKRWKKKAIIKARNGRKYDRKGRFSNCENLRDIESKSKQDNSILKQFFGAISQAGIQLFIGSEKGMENHSDKNGENRCPHNRKKSS